MPESTDPTKRLTELQQAHELCVGLYRSIDEVIELLRTLYVQSLRPPAKPSQEQLPSALGTAGTLARVKALSKHEEEVRRYIAGFRIGYSEAGRVFDACREIDDQGNVVWERVLKYQDYFRAATWPSPKAIAHTVAAGAAECFLDWYWGTISDELSRALADREISFDPEDPDFVLFDPDRADVWVHAIQGTTADTMRDFLHKVGAHSYKAISEDIPTLRVEYIRARTYLFVECAASKMLGIADHVAGAVRKPGDVLPSCAHTDAEFKKPEWFKIHGHIQPSALRTAACRGTLGKKKLPNRRNLYCVTCARDQWPHIEAVSG